MGKQLRWFNIVFLMALAQWGLFSTPVESADVSFAGKTIRIIVSSSAGGGTDTVARLIARYLPRYLPGQPTTIVQNMPGGGGLVSNNYFYRAGKKNGLDLFSDSSSGITGFTRGGARVKYDPRKFEYIGSVMRGGSLVMVRKDARPRMTDPKARPVVVGDPDGNRTWLAACIWGKEYLGWNLRFIVGYAGTAELALALRQGEIDMWSTANDQILDDLKKEGIVDFLVQAESDRRSDYPNIPTFIEYLGDKRPSGISWQAYRVWTAPSEVDKPLSLPPGTPANIVKIYREATMKMSKDPEFKRDAKKFFGPAWLVRDGKATAQLVNEASDVSKEVVEYMNNMRRKNNLPVPK